jgi:hypothetical protein
MSTVTGSLTSRKVSNSRTGTNLRRRAVQRGFGWQANRSRARWARFCKRVLERFRERTRATIEHLTRPGCVSSNHGAFVSISCPAGPRVLSHARTDPTHCPGG